MQRSKIQLCEHNVFPIIIFVSKIGMAAEWVDAQLKKHSLRSTVLQSSAAHFVGVGTVFHSRLGFVMTHVMLFMAQPNTLYFCCCYQANLCEKWLPRDQL